MSVERQINDQAELEGAYDAFLEWAEENDLEDTEENFESWQDQMHEDRQEYLAELYYEEEGWHDGYYDN